MAPGEVGTPASIVRAYLAISGLFTLAASVIWGVNTLFLLDAGLDIFQVFIASGSFTAGMMLFEIPTGVVADTSGRRLRGRGGLAGGRVEGHRLSRAARPRLRTRADGVGHGDAGRVGGRWPARQPRPGVAVMRRVLHTSLAVGWPVRLLMLVSLVHGTFTMWSWNAWQPYLLGLLGRDAVWVAGVVAALTALATIAGNALVEVLTRFCGRRTTLLLAAMAVLAVATVGVGLAGSFWAAVALLLALSAGEGVVAPVQQAYLHEVVPSAQRASVVSSVSLVSSPGGVAGQLGLGWIARAQSLAAGYLAGGLAMLAGPPLLRLRRMHQRADVIAGRRAGSRGSCAAQGLPVVASVDTLPRHPTAAATGHS
jgi:Major Facilitator Superfamily